MNHRALLKLAPAAIVAAPASALCVADKADPQESEFLNAVFNMTPDEIRAACALAEADPDVTPGCLNLVRVLRDYADKFQADLERAGVDIGQE